MSESFACIAFNVSSKSSFVTLSATSASLVTR